MELQFVESGYRKQDRPASLYRCFCGAEFIARNTDVSLGKVKSCGCLWKRHSMRNHPLYDLWHGMVSRCTNPKFEQYQDYGGRGITVCDRWLNVAAFISDITEELGDRPKGYQLDRKDNNKGYCPGNVRWTTPKQNCRNTRRNRMLTVDGETKCASEWAEETGLHVQTILWRANNNKHPLTGKNL